MQWIAGWNKRIKFEIDHTKVDEDLTNFPVLVNLDTTYSGVFNELGNNYKKISFMNPSTGEEYYCEVERWDYNEYSAQLWVKIPEISSTENTEFYMLFDNSANDNNHINKTCEVNWSEIGSYTDGTLSNDASVVSDYIRLTRAVDSIHGEYNVSITDNKNFSVEFEHWSGEGDGADEVMFKWGDSYKYVISIDEYRDIVYFKYDEVIKTESSCSNIDNSTWGHVKIVVTVRNDIIYIKCWFRGTKYIDYSMTFVDYTSDILQWSARTGGLNNEHRVKNLYVKTIGSINVWDENYVAVYHMSQDPSQSGACILDSTSNANHGTPHGSMTSSDLVDANVGKGLDFDGSDDYIDIGIPYEINDNPFTVDAVIINKDNSETERMFFDNVSGSNWDNRTFLGSNQTGYTGKYRWFARNDSNDDNIYSINNESNKWVLVSALRNTTKRELLVNGSYQSESSLTGDFSQGANIWVGASNASSGSSFWLGTISEIRISKIKRSYAWTKTTYYSSFDTLLIKGSVETVPSTELDYAHKIKILIPHYSENSDLYDFPVLINLCSMAGKNGTDLTDVFEKLGSSVNRKKIAITDYTKVSQLYVEIERWSQADQSAQLWIKVPFISRTCDTELYIYYDPDKEDNYLMVGDTDSIPAEKVWSSYDTVLVYHLSSYNNNIVDSTSNSNDGTPSNITNDNIVEGIAGKALRMDADSSSISTNHNSTLKLPAHNFTVSLLFKATETLPSSSNPTYIYIKDDWEYGLWVSNSEIRSHFNYNGTIYYQTYSVSLSVNNWYYIVSTWGDSNNIKTYINTDLKSGSGSSSSNRPLDDEPLLIEGSKSTHVLSNFTLHKQSVGQSWININYLSYNDNLIIYDTLKSSWLKTYENGELSPWANRIKIEIDNFKVDEVLEDFPVLINLSEDSGINDKNIGYIFDELKTSYVTCHDDFTGTVLNDDLWDTHGTTAGCVVSQDDWLITHVDGSTNNGCWAFTKEYFDFGYNYVLEIDIQNITGPDTHGFGTSICIAKENGTRGGWAYGLADNCIAIWLGSGKIVTFVNAGAGTSTQATFTPVVDTGVVHKIKININKDNTFELYIDGSHQATFVLNSSDAAAIGDAFQIELGLGTYRQVYSSYFDNLNLTIFKDLYEKVAITSGDGSTQLPVEVERWDSTDKSAQLWAKVPVIKPCEKTVLYLYYDKNKSNNTDYVGYTGSFPAKNVWDGDFVGVYHLSQYPKGNNSILDSTTNSRHGSPNGSMTYSDVVDSYVGKGLEFDGSDDYISLPDIIDPSENITLEAFFNSDNSSTSDYIGILTSQYISNDYVESALYINDSSTHRLRGGFYDGSWHIASNDTDVDDGSYHYGAYTYNGSTVSLLCDTSAFNAAHTGTLPSNDRDWRIGARWDAEDNGGWFEGIISEVRVSKSTRPMIWLKTTRTTLLDNLLYYYDKETYEEYSFTPTYFFEGNVYENNTPIKTNVYLYRSSNGKLVDSTISDDNGYYKLLTPYNESHMIVCINDNYKPLVKYDVFPVI